MGQLIRNGVSSISLAARGAEGGRALEVGDAPPSLWGVSRGGYVYWGRALGNMYVPM